MFSICKGSFWDTNLTWNSEVPDFTPCFQSTVLNHLPLVTFFIVSCLEILWKRKKRKIQTNDEQQILSEFKDQKKLRIKVFSPRSTRLLLTLLLLITTGLETLSLDYSDNLSYLFTVLSFLTWLWSLFLLIFYYDNSFDSHFTLYATSLLCGFFRLRSHGTSEWTLLSQVSLFILLFLILFLSSFSRKKNGNLRFKASLFSQLSFSWVTLFIWKGYKHSVLFEEVSDLNSQFKTKRVYNNFLSYYTVSKKKKNGLFRSLLSSVLSQFLLCFFLRLLSDILLIASPQILKLIISHVESSENYKWKGVFFATLLLILTFIKTLTINHYFFKLQIISLKVQSSLLALVYQKALRVSSATTAQKTGGEIVNYMSVDITRLNDAFQTFHLLWSFPLQIVFALYYMYNEIGVSIAFGAGVLIVAIPLNIYVGSLTKSCQVSQMKQKDARLKIMNEILIGIRIIKLYVWEKSFRGRVEGIRSEEIKILKRMSWLSAFLLFLWTCIPLFVLFASFASFVYLDETNVLSPQKIFVTLSYINLIRIPMIVFPATLVSLITANVSLKRLEDFLSSPEFDSQAVDKNSNSSSEVAISIVNGVFTWNSDGSKNTLENITLNISRGSLTAIVGVIASGKSSLLSAILGEIVKKSGTVEVNGTIAYVSQESWLQNASIKNNITFKCELNETRYKEIIDKCALRPDLDIFPDSDQTEVGEGGINLSGGQKQRISLARATYSDAEVYLLDDPLSAVDSHVGKQIFNDVLSNTSGLLAGKTRVFVTHGVQYLPYVDDIIVLKDGHISERGTYNDLMTNNQEFSAFIKEYAVNNSSSTCNNEDSNNSNSLPKNTSSISNEKEIETSKAKKLIENETLLKNSVQFSVYKYYMKHIGLTGLAFVCAFQILNKALSIGSSRWLQIWGDQELGNSSLPRNRDMYLGVYGAFGLGQAFCTAFVSLSLSLLTLHGGKGLHNRVLNSILKSPMSFFERTPLGRLLNRFSKDVDTLDTSLRHNITIWFSTFSNLGAIVILIFTVIPLFSLVLIPLFLLFYMIQRMYVCSSRQLKRLESNTRSPIYSLFGETYSGSSLIRAYGKDTQFMNDMKEKIDSHQKIVYMSYVANRWLFILLENIGNLSTFAASVFVLLQYSDISGASKVGLVITQTMNLTMILNMVVRITAQIENDMVSVERLKEYTDLEPEEKTSGEEKKNWPDRGAINFIDYSMKYGSESHCVLKSINLFIRGGERVAIVGRTGAGKSSLSVGLFRLVEAAGGQILIDNENIASLPLEQLRRALTIIPQDPILISGSIRFNLDPFDEYSDAHLWNVLETTNLKEYILGLGSNGLSEWISEGGRNLSVGQRQLLCLSRAMLKPSKVLLLDEATAAVDLETDQVIQRTLRSSFLGMTLLTIAHRLSTILDYDRVIVMDDGSIIENGSPSDLLLNPNSHFYSMIRDSGLLPN